MAIMAPPPSRFLGWFPRPRAAGISGISGISGMTLALFLALAGCGVPEPFGWRALEGGADGLASPAPEDPAPEYPAPEDPAPEYPAPEDIAGMLACFAARGGMLASAPGIEGGADDDRGDVPGAVAADPGAYWGCAPREGVAWGIALGFGVEEGLDEPWTRRGPGVPGDPWPDPIDAVPTGAPTDIAQPVPPTVPWSPFGNPPGIDDDDGETLPPVTGLTIAGPAPSWPWVPLRWGGGEGNPVQPARAAPAPPGGPAVPPQEGGPDAPPDSPPDLHDQSQAPPIASIAEPATVVLLGGAIVALGLLRRRAKR